MPEIRDRAVEICVYTTLISMAWWQNFANANSFLAPIRRLAVFATRLTEKRSKTYVVISLWKCFIYTFCLFYFLTPNRLGENGIYECNSTFFRIHLENLFQPNIFGERLITIVAKDLNQTQIEHFQARMHEYEMPGLNIMHIYFFFYFTFL